MAVIDDKNKPVQQAGDVQNVASRSGEDVMDIDSNTANGDTLIATSPVREEPPSPQEQSTIISDLFQKHGTTMGADQVWYLISAKWARAYRAFANLSDNWTANEEPSQFTASPPSQIDNESLVTAPTTGGNDPFLSRVRKTVTEGMDYEVLPQQVWDKLYAWFGGGPVIARRTYQKGTKYQIAIHPYFVSVGLCGKGAAADMSKNPLTFKEIGVSRTTPMKELKTIIKKLFNITGTPDSDLRLFSAHSGSPYQLYSDEELDREVEEIIERPQGQQLILEEKNATAPYWRIKAADDSESEPIKSKSSGATVYSFADKKSYTDKYSSTYTNSNNGDNVTSEPGVCGLQNLGNTCFMNSALQCLTKTPVIRDYFVNGTYQDEINRDNPLGMGGKIAEAFGNLMKDGFSGRHSYISPREFKHVIGKFAPQFSGYQQQDSQELIAYLLDGLHEDLNRIKKKPVTESVESNGRPDDVVADEAWKTHRLRNDSVIVDKFQGQLKSELVCPDCENVSITFDPFMYLSLPLPVERHRSIDVTVFFYGNRRAPLKIQVQVQKGGDIVELRKAIADMVGIAKPQNLAVVEVFSNKVYRYFSDSTDIKAILDSDIIMAYEMKEDIEFPEDIHTKYTNYDLKALPFASVRMATTAKEEYRSAYSNNVTVTYRTSYISHPFVLPFDQKQSTNKALYDHCLDYLRPYLKPEEVERLGLNLNDPASLLYKGPTEKQKLRMEAEKERQRKIREKEEKQRRAYLNRYSHDSSDSDTMADEDKEDEEPQIPADDDEEEEQLLLFTLQFEDSSSYGPAKLDALDNVLPYNDNIVEVPREKYSYSTSDKKTLVMYINPVCIEGLIDQQALKQVDLHDSIKPVKTGGEKGAVSSDSCLELFTTREKLSSNDTWYCPKCKKHVEAYKKFDLWRLPEVLVVHLKRFQYNRYTRDKLETFIDYPIEGLDLSKHVEHNLGGNPNRRYDLFAVSNHYGGLGGGHYTAYAKIQRKNQWYKFDDSYTSPVSADSVKTSSGYVLFYKLANNQTTNNMEE